MGWGYYDDYPAYVPVAERKANAVLHAAKAAKKSGRAVSPVAIQGLKISKSFWGISWCENLEAYSDYASRLPRGRTYVRNGSVVDLQIQKGTIEAIVAGSEPYKISITIQDLPKADWQAIKRECAGQIGSLVELLQGKLSKAVMEIVTRKGTGLFPKPKEINMRCSCPDSAGLCKHLAAVMYGIGARLDQQPELLFILRKVDNLELIEGAGQASLGTAETSGTKTIAADDLSEMFGIEMLETEPSSTSASKPKSSRKTKTAKQGSTTKTAADLATIKRKPVKSRTVAAVDIPIAPVGSVAVKSAKPQRKTKQTPTQKSPKSKSTDRAASKPKGLGLGKAPKQSQSPSARSLARSAK